MMLSGIGNYFLIVGGWVDPLSAKRTAAPLIASVALQAAILIAAVAALWPRRAEPRLRAIAIVFLGTLGAGQVLNLYAQPQDPQMQLNVMPWLAVAWALLLGALAARARAGSPIALAVASLLPFVWNVGQLARFRGGDEAALKAVAALEQRFPPASTVFVYWGFEPITMWQYALWSRTWDWDGTSVGHRRPEFKWIAIDAGAIRHPDWTAGAQRRGRSGATSTMPSTAAIASSSPTSGPGARPNSPASSAPCPPPIARRRSTGCCTTAIGPGRSSPNRRPAATTNCGGADRRGKT